MLDALADHPHDPALGGSLGLGPLDCGRHGAPWRVARYEGGQHHIARPALHRLGVSTFLPLLRLEVPDRRLGRRIVTVPAFPGCLFVQWRDGFDWPRILAQPGMIRGSSGIVRPVGQPHGEPAVVPERYMEHLFSRASDGGVIEDASVEPELPPIAEGARVRVVRGPFAGAEGLCGLSAGQRVAVLFEIMGGTRRVAARRRDVEPV